MYRKEVMYKRKLEPIEKFYALYANYYFTYPVVDEDGKPLLQTNTVTGNVLRDTNGQPRFVMKMEQFKPIRTKMSQGFLSEAVFDPNTKDQQELARGKALRELAAQDGIDVLTEDKKDQHENYAAWEEKKKRKELEERLENAEAQASKAEALEKRIRELEAGK